MDEKNQILDVTYGNFSCRLEGFDDSVETMKAVVSFFHDLAGHSRFMDVAPQAPDMETLARLTEEQSGTAVEVEVDGNHVSLRAVSDDVAEDVSDETDDIADDLEEHFAEELTDADEASEDETASDDVEALDSDASVSDKLDRIRAVVSRDAAPSESDDFAEDLSEADEKPRGINPLAQRLADLAKRTSQTRVLNASNDYIESDVAKVAENAASRAEDHVEEYVDDLEMDLEEEVDTKVVTNEPHGDDAVEEDDASDEVEAVAEIEETDDDGEETLTEVDEALLAADESHDDVAEDLEVGLDEDTEDALEEAEIDDEDIVEDEVEEFEAEEAVAVPELDDVATQTDPVEETTDEIEEPTAEVDAADTPAEEVSEAQDEDNAAAAKARETSTTLVLTPSDAAVVVPEGVDPAKVENATDDDFDLATEVALVEAEIARRQGNEVARHGLSRRVEDAMSRIMSQTDQHLNKPESRRHRDAFAQLKAAVAATEAARQLGDKGDAAPDPDEVFKNDLGAHAAGPSDDANSDKIRPLDAASERLREIASKKEAEGIPEKTGFAEFADAHSAIDLVDLLEAAGAYICFVEGEADFSRPQVMKVVQTASDKEISREDGLRCFGRLLRQTRIVKLANGRFQVADTSQYRPDERKAQAR